MGGAADHRDNIGRPIGRQLRRSTCHVLFARLKSSEFIQSSQQNRSFERRSPSNGETTSQASDCVGPRAVREHFANLYLLEIKIEPTDADVNWSAITQPIESQAKDNWQVPYDEHRLDEREGHWAFFFHCLDRSRPLQTELGDQKLPTATPIPPHLHGVLYEVPG